MTMAMTKEEHDEIIVELQTEELETSRRVELLQSLRDDYTGVHATLNEFTETQDKLKKKNDDLLLSNSQMFLKLGTTPEERKKEEEKPKTKSLAQIEQEARDKGIIQ